MKRRLVDWLACPACGDGSFDLVIDRAVERLVWAGQVEPGEEMPGVSDGRITEIEEGRLTCQDCGEVFRIEAGVPRLLPAGSPVAPGTGHRLTEFEAAAPEFEENFRDLLDPVQPEAFLGRLVLDAGCGFGRHTWYAARYGAEVVGLDASEEAVSAAARNLRDNVRAHVVLGDVERPPFKKSLFDLVYCFGVLHHTGNPTRAFGALDELVNPGGRLSVWVYGPRQGLTRIATGALRGATAQMTADQLLGTSRFIASALRVFSHTPHRLLGANPLFASIVTHLPVHDHSRWPYDVVVADVYDRLRIPVTAYFRGEDLERWYAEAGYADIQVSRRVRNTESFRGTGVRR